MRTEDLVQELPLELRLGDFEPSQSENAYGDLLDIIGRLSDVQADAKRLSTWSDSTTAPSDEESDRFLARTRSIVNSWDQALMKPAYQPPTPDVDRWLDADAYDGPVDPMLGGIRTLRDVGIGRARALATLGKHGEVWTEVQRVFRTSQIMRRGHLLAIEYLVVQSLDHSAIHATRRWVGDLNPPRSVVARVLDNLPPFHAVDPAEERMFVYELNRFLLPATATQTIEQVARTDYPVVTYGRDVRDLWPLGDPDLLDRKKTAALYGQLFAALVADARRPLPKRTQESRRIHGRIRKLMPATPWVDEDREPTDREMAKFRRAAEKIPNALGLSCAAQLTLYGGNWARMEAQKEVLKAVLATYINGRRPKNLDELVALSICKELPMDPYSLRPLHYNRRTGKIWSVGENGRNENGGGDDLTMDLALPNR